jgi:hypothetical protein
MVKVNIFIIKLLSWDRSVGIATRLRAGRQRGSIPGRGYRFFCSAWHPDRLTRPPIQWVLGINRQGREADHSSDAEIKNG